MIAALRKVFDPEMPVNIYELGLVYACTVDAEGVVSIRMTLTAPNCPVAGTLPGDVERAARAVPGVTDVKLELVFDPPWTKAPHVRSRQTGSRNRRYYPNREAAKKMKLTANEEYGIRCLVRLGYAGFNEQALTIPEISQAEGVSSAYAGKILRVLRKGGFVKAARGKEGGYTLARPAEKIVIGDVIDALGGRLFESDFCDSHSGQAAICTRSVDCSVRSLWRAVQVAIDQVLSKTTPPRFIAERRRHELLGAHHPRRQRSSSDPVIPSRTPLFPPANPAIV
ncbi:MAG: Rrf2 family transcriptional regulator [Ignavibacteriota bacterium]